MNVSLKIVVYGILFVCVTSIGIQQSFSESSSNQPLNYDIRTKVVDVGNIDLGTGSFEMVFWTIMSPSDDESNFNKTPPPELDYVNAKEYTIITNRTSEDGTDYRAKITGTFFVEDLHFKLYPYMEMELNVNIETAGKQVEEVKFHSQKGAEKKAGWMNHTSGNEPLIPGWINHNVEFGVTDERYNNDTEVYSSFNAKYSIEKPFLSSFVVGILPILIMGIIASITFLLDPIRHEFKAGVIGGILMAAVFFQVANVDQIPSLEYLTLEDKIMTTFYGVLIVMMTELLAQWKYNPENNQEKAKKINKKFRIILPIIAIAIFAILNHDIVF